ncbi:MAG: IS66 family insertion sequence element accessory protein TnpA, partial [Planctomycetota bacterium]
EPWRGGAEPGPGGPAPRRDPKSLGRDERRELVQRLEASGERMRAFCAAHGISTTTLAAWRRRFTCEVRAAAEQARRSKHAARDPVERRRAVEAYRKSGMRAEAFARVWGVTAKSLWRWAKIYEREGLKGLEDRRRGRPKGTPAPLPPSLKGEITKVLRRFPFFGWRRVRDWLRRFRGMEVGVRAVRRVRAEEALPEATGARKVRRGKPQVRRFERSRPRELWQSDLTSVDLPKDGRRVYLVVFLDDFSRYVVGWRLAPHQKGEMVIEALLDGISRFGKPKEVLTDQGRQYSSWRGENDFQKLLRREGIGHVVARSHHPQTVGKCERLWETLRAEFWDRIQPKDLDEAKERLAHFFAHDNHFRPHQGIEGLVPADRFFGAKDVARRTLEERLDRNELSLAIEEAPRSTVYLFGQVGDRHVSVHGEAGKVVIETDGERQEIEAGALGAPGGRDGGDGGEEGAPIPQAPLQGGAEDAGAGEGAVGGGERGGAEAGARDLRDDPRAVAREDDAGGRVGAEEGPAAPGVAALAAGAGGDGGGTAPATAVAEVGETGGRFRGPEGAFAEDPGARARGQGERRPDRASKGASGASREGDGGGDGETAWSARPDDESPTSSERSGSGSERCSGRDP